MLALALMIILFNIAGSDITVGGKRMLLRKNPSQVAARRLGYVAFAAALIGGSWLTFDWLGATAVGFLLIGSLRSVVKPTDSEQP